MDMFVGGFPSIWSKCWALMCCEQGLTFFFVLSKLVLMFVKLVKLAHLQITFSAMPLGLHGQHEREFQVQNKNLASS
ncbi:hypothetical protein GDO78_010040 [Eleutherodactylus coqui]|uniref:Uncharacterized protein n=1 Tax=Eleutherodactylus coqui TaxID=57060 RepID=A0A8J6K9V1_ELECQ|nr:hypothetical protein GDO78_010040 [Eleutherodactylus coqui]